MSVQENQAVRVGVLHSLQTEPAVIIQSDDGAITICPESEVLVNTRPAEYDDLAAFNSTIVSALVGHGEYLIDLTQEELCNLYNSTLQAIISLESNRYDQSLGI